MKIVLVFRLFVTDCDTATIAESLQTRHNGKRHYYIVPKSVQSPN
jgi:hypothetical protein